VPIMNLCGQYRACRKGQCQSKSRSKSLHLTFSVQSISSFENPTQPKSMGELRKVTFW
jgi:hypothetical protein